MTTTQCLACRAEEQGIDVYDPSDPCAIDPVGHSCPHTWGDHSQCTPDLCDSVSGIMMTDVPIPMQPEGLRRVLGRAYHDVTLYLDEHGKAVGASAVLSCYEERHSFEPDPWTGEWYDVEAEPVRPVGDVRDVTPDEWDHIGSIF